jgi:ABC-2 type transport system permease protein
MNGLTYTRFELLRMVRNTRFFLFSLGFPLLLFYLVAGPNENQQLGGLSFPVYYMVGMASWGTMAAVLAGGARIAAERSVGWTRQLRVTPLSARTYFQSKIVSGYLMASVSIVAIFAAGWTVGVRLPAAQWLQMSLLILVGLVPFAVGGILLGHLLTVDSMGPALGGVTSLLALLGGAWGPIGNDGWLHPVVQCLPSYWLVQAGQAALGGSGWPARAWVVVALWTIALTVVARRVYRRDTGRV